MKSVLRLACAIAVLAIGACTPSNMPSDKSSELPTYVQVLPLPGNGTLRDILIRDGKPVGQQDPTTPDDPTVRIVHGRPSQAQALFDTLSKGGTPIPSAVGKAFKLPDGAIVAYYENDVPTNGKMSVGSVTIFVFADGIPVTQLRFYVPPCGHPVCFVPYEGGGGM